MWNRMQQERWVRVSWKCHTLSRVNGRAVSERHKRLIDFPGLWMGRLWARYLAFPVVPLLTLFLLSVFIRKLCWKNASSAFRIMLWGCKRPESPQTPFYPATCFPMWRLSLLPGLTILICSWWHSRLFAKLAADGSECCCCQNCYHNLICRIIFLQSHVPSMPLSCSSGIWLENPFYWPIKFARLCNLFAFLTLSPLWNTSSDPSVI